MAELIQRKQIDWVQSAPVLVQNFTTSASSTDNVTSTITTALRELHKKDDPMVKLLYP